MMVFAKKKQQGIEAKENPNIYLEQMAIKVRQLSPGEVAERFKDKGPFIPEMFPSKRTFEINGRVYGVTFKKRFLELRMDPKAKDLTVLKAYISVADAAIGKLSSMVENYDRKEFPLVIISEKPSRMIAGTHVMVGDDPFPSIASVIEVNKDELERLSNLPKNNLAGLYTATTATLKSIESTLLHEAIHDFRGHYFGSKRENLALLGGFLRDPAGNWSDHDRFEALSKALRDDQNPTKEQLEWAKRYKEHIEEWSKIAKILILELNKIFPKVAIPESRSGQLYLVTRLHSYYSEVPQEKRDEIFRGYIRLPDEKIDQIADDARQKFKLEF
ncbi:hypothetical protein H0N98_03475 [Candidatus Micrarchaeota archaeon]|nr:hypothetical protein [Candidatus Micrarchaeota archaeon]